MSIGCGIGYLENEINLDFKGKLIGIEPSNSSCNFMRKNANVECLNGFFPGVFKNNNEHFDFAYMGAIEYVFNDLEYKSFLKSIVDYGIKDLLVISVSHYNPVRHRMKEFIKKILIKIGVYEPVAEKGQFWGYMRTRSEHIRLMKQAGFKKISTRYCNNALFLRGII